MRRVRSFLIPVLVLLPVSLLAVPTWALQSETATPPERQADRSNTVTPSTKQELGRLLFFDPRLSGDGLTSCASCHMPGKAWTDGLLLSAGYTSTLYFRNTPTLLNASRMSVFDWDGRFAQGDMDSLVRDHLAEAHFMHIDGRLAIERLRQVPEYEEGFREAFDSEVSYGRILSSLSAFVETLASINHPYLRYRDGDTNALSAEAREGLDLFRGKAGCAQCHSGNLLSDGKLYALGVPENPAVFQEPLRHITFRRFFRGLGVSEYATMRQDPGLYALTFNEADRGRFRTPSLLEAARTGPYMHNGVLTGLEDVVRFYDSGGGDNQNKDSLLKPLGLTDQEVASLVAFLESLGSQEEPFEVPELPPYQARKLGDN